MKVAAFVLSTIPVLIQLYARKYMAEDKAITLDELEGNVGIPRIKSYDFIIVGGGTSGCVLAGRLSERFNVLLLENGGPPVPASQVPFFVEHVGYDIETNYQFASVPQRNANRQGGGVIVSHLGKMLGGSGSHNDMVHNRGSPHDYDNYARIVGDDSWNYENVVEYFKKSENFIGQLFTNNATGPVTVDTDVPPFLPKWFEAGEELGFPIGDPNGYQIESFTPMAKAIDKGQRSSSYLKHLKPYMDRDTLTVLPYSFVTELLIDENKVAYGVLYERHGIPQIAHASKEVIVSAGAYSSPLLLMRSGVGPRSELEEAEIPVKHDLPELGGNLQDHLMIVMRNFTWNSSAIPYFLDMPTEDSEFQQMLNDYHETGEGIIGHLQEGPQAFIVSQRAKQNGEANWPDIQINFDHMCPATPAGELPKACAYVWNVRPKSQGRLGLNTTAYKMGLRDDMSLALIDFQLYEGAEAQTDVDVLLEAIDYTLKILDTNALKSLGVSYDENPLPACASHEFMSEAYWRCVITETSYTTFHSVGTCSLGSVVDAQFRVQGISNLRVVDGSVFPYVPNANLNAPVLMIAEKAADNIYEDHFQK